MKTALEDILYIILLRSSVLPFFHQFSRPFIFLIYLCFPLILAGEKRVGGNSSCLNWLIVSKHKIEVFKLPYHVLAFIFFNSFHFISELVMTWNRHDVQCFVVPSQANHSTPPRPPPESPSNSYFVKVPASSWITFIQEVTRGKFKRINRQWSKVNSSSLAVHLNPPTPKTDYNEGKWADIYTTRLTTGGKVNVLLGSEVCLYEID